MKSHISKTLPLAYAYAENGCLHTELHWAQMEEASFGNIIGKDLVNFAYVDDESLYAVILEISDICRNMAKQQASVDAIARTVLEKCVPLLQINLYFSIYLMSFLGFIFDGTIDRRVFPGDTRSERLLKKASRDTKRAEIMDVIDLTYEAYQAKRKLAESALQTIYEDKMGEGLTPLERYYRREQEDPVFQKHLHTTFTVKLGRRSTGDHSVTQLTVLDTVDDLLRYELFLLVTQGRQYKFCKNCGKPFIPSGRSDIVYCDRIMIGSEKRCNEIGAYMAEVKKVAGNPVLNAYRKAYQRLHKRVELGCMEDQDFSTWKGEAVKMRDLCLAGDLDEKEFADWINRTSRQRREK